ncbi:MAG: hypothetical protein IPL79_18725 [Myxococcales bacterium]|nr:hypothetical protein [Myxococcales bacterium]
MGASSCLSIGPAPNQPVQFMGKGYARSGASKVDLSRHPDKARALWTKGQDWSAAICDHASLEDLDPLAIAKARDQFREKNPAKASELSAWTDLAFLNKTKLLKQGAITGNAAAPAL